MAAKEGVRLQHESGWRLLALGMETKKSSLIINLAARNNKIEQSCASIGSSLDSMRLKRTAGQGQRASESLYTRVEGKRPGVQDRKSLKRPLPPSESEFGAALRSGALEAAERAAVESDPFQLNRRKDAMKPNGNAALPRPPRSSELPAPRSLRAVRVRVPAGTRAHRSFRHRGRNSAKLGAALASLAAAAVLLAALVGSRSSPGPATAPLPGAAEQPAAPGAGSAGLGPVAVPPAAQLPAAPAASELPSVSVYLTKTGGIETLPLEQYVTGVLAAEMPADFELEALKAQAIAARTFIVRRLADGDRSGVPVKGADVVDSVDHQAYLSSKELDKWPELGKSEQLAKLRRAVEETKGIIMTYHGKPITATFFSASGGYTENSEEYWSLKLPYLRSVPSPWEKTVNPSFKQTVTISMNELFAKLGLKTPALPVTASVKDKEPSLSSAASFQIKAYTAGRSVKSMLINDHSFTGRELREKLGLRSAQFTMRLDGDNVQITTYGNGHGVGMSQWGAHGMAKQGYTTTQILKHYYTGISFEQASALLKS
ncbi:stage II sporulation protein D [Paenibacillus lentus]|uniref:stage II sporulation protein D n=1 Tax=Paenibacillus lentus TaxID=1338368 RepID=UPI00364DD061